MRWFDIAEELLPPAYKAIKDVYAYAKSLNGELTEWTGSLERILKNFFVQTCDTQTVEYWEEKLGITPRPDETLDQRREVILEHLNNQNAITEPYVREKIENMFPGCTYKLWFDIEHNKPYDLYIEIFTKDMDSFLEFRSWIFKMAPAHIYPFVEFAMDGEEVDPKAYHTEITWERANLGTIGTISPATYNVTLTPGSGYTLAAESGSSSPVIYGGSFSFSFTLAERYTKADDFAVLVNGTTLTGTNDVYTITGIRSDQTVTVQGVTEAGIVALGLMTALGDVALRFVRQETMGGEDIRTAPFIQTPIIHSGIIPVFTFPTVTLYPAVTQANATFTTAQSIKKLSDGYSYALYEESSSVLYDYLDGMICVGYTTATIYNSSSYTSTEHWVYGSSSSGWEPLTSFTVVGNEVGGVEKSVLCNVSESNRSISGVLIAHIDGQYSGLVKIYPSSQNTHKIYAAWCNDGTTDYYWPMLSATTDWMTLSELNTAGFELDVQTRALQVTFVDNEESLGQGEEIFGSGDGELNLTKSLSVDAPKKSIQSEEELEEKEFDQSEEENEVESDEGLKDVIVDNGKRVILVPVEQNLSNRK